MHVPLPACALMAATLAVLPAEAADIADFAGVWEQAGENCTSSRAGMEGNYVTIGEGVFEGGAGGFCHDLTMTVTGRTLTITGICSGEEEDPAPLRSVYTLSGRHIVDEFGQTFERCPPRD